MDLYAEPVDLVDATIRRIGLSPLELAAIERQRRRSLSGGDPITLQVTPVRQTHVKPFPNGPFRFFALDVETANNDRSSICQIGVACVRPDNSIVTWMTYIDPQSEVWIWSSLHGITAQTVRGAPTFVQMLPILNTALNGGVVYQHSGFDRGAIVAACVAAGLSAPFWHWRDSVQVARAAWPELKGNGGHGLGHLKQHLGLNFDHHDAEEDARASAEVVLRAEGARPSTSMHRPIEVPSDAGDAYDFDLIEECDAAVEDRQAPEPAPNILASPAANGLRLIGKSQITQGNVDNSHIYLRAFFEKFPADAVGGSNRSAPAPREIAVDWGGETVVMTDLDGAKRFFRKRGWIRTFFEKHDVVAGDWISVEETAPYTYRVSLERNT